MFIKTEEKGFVLPAVTEYLSMQSIISNCCSTTSNHNLFPGSVCCPLVPLQECSWGCNSETTWSVLKNNLRETRKLGIWASQDSFWGIHWECQDKYCIIITGNCPPVPGIYTVRLVSAVTPLGDPKGNVQSWDFSCYMLLCLWEGRAEEVWQDWLWFFLSAAVGRKLHFHSLSLFQKQLPTPGYLLGAQMQVCLRSGSPDHVKLLGTNSKMKN